MDMKKRVTLELRGRSPAEVSLLYNPSLPGISRSSAMAIVEAECCSQLHSLLTRFSAITVPAECGSLCDCSLYSRIYWYYTNAVPSIFAITLKQVL